MSADFTIRALAGRWLYRIWFPPGLEPMARADLDPAGAQMDRQASAWAMEPKCRKLRIRFQL